MTEEHASEVPHGGEDTIHKQKRRVQSDKRQNKKALKAKRVSGGDGSERRGEGSGKAKKRKLDSGDDQDKRRKRKKCHLRQLYMEVEDKIEGVE